MLTDSLIAKHSRKHRNSLVLKRLALTVSHKLQPVLVKLNESMKNLELQITKARCPICKGLELLPPSKLYTRENNLYSHNQAKKIIMQTGPHLYADFINTSANASRICFAILNIKENNYSTKQKFNLSLESSDALTLSSLRLSRDIQSFD